VPLSESPDARDLPVEGIIRIWSSSSEPVTKATPVATGNLEIMSELESEIQPWQCRTRLPSNAAAISERGAKSRRDVAELRFSSAHPAKRATVAATRTYSSGASGIDWWRHHYSLPVVNCI